MAQPSLTQAGMCLLKLPTFQPWVYPLCKQLVAPQDHARVREAMRSFPQGLPCPLAPPE